MVPTSMTLNGVTALILRFFSPSLISLLAKDVTVVEYRPIMSVNIVSISSSLPLLAKLHCIITHPAVLSAIAELLVARRYG